MLRPCEDNSPYDGGIYMRPFPRRKTLSRWLGSSQKGSTNHSENFHNKKSHPKRWNCDKMFLLPFCLGLLDCIFLLDQCWLKDNHFAGVQENHNATQKDPVSHIRHVWIASQINHPLAICIVDINEKPMTIQAIPSRVLHRNPEVTPVWRRVISHWIGASL